MPNFPVMFTFRDVVSGNGYLAGVTVFGRALMAKEEDGKWWVYGVRPAALAASGKTPLEAFNEFRNSYRLVLFDFAETAENFTDFKGTTEQFYSQPDADEESRWLAAFSAIREGRVKIEPFFTELPKESPEKRPTGITVLALNQIQRYNATDNVPDRFEFAAAA